MLSCCILVHQTAYDVFCIIELVETVAEERCFLEMLNMGLSALEFVELDAQRVEDVSYTGVIGQHHATDFVLGWHVGTLLCKCNLD